MDELEQLTSLIDELRDDVTQLALAVQMHGAWLAAITRTLSAEGITVDGAKAPTLQ